MGKAIVGPITDAQLVEGCRRGDPTAQEMLYRRFFSYAMSISIRYTPSPEDAMEVVNDSFLKAFAAMGQVDTQRPFKGWFARVVVNTAIDSYRRRRRAVLEGWADEANDCGDVEVSGIDLLTAQDILQLFDQLPETYRITYNMYEIEGYSHQEIAQSLNTTPATSRANLSRAKRMLRELYQKHFQENLIHREAI